MNKCTNLYSRLPQVNLIELQLFLCLDKNLDRKKNKNLKKGLSTVEMGQEFVAK